MSLKPGERFNPYKMFNGIFIPEGLARSKAVRPGAKLAWGRLARYAGENGECYPSMRALAAEIGVGVRQVQKYVTELERHRLIRRMRRFAGRAQTSNGFEFLFHEMFEANDSSGEGVNDSSLPPVNDSSPKESQIEESHSEERKTDIDCLPHFEKEIDWCPTAAEPSGGRQYPNVRECLALYMQLPGEAKDYPTDRIVVDIMEAAGTHDEQEVISALVYLHRERGLKPFTKKGPRSFAWFKTVLQDHFTKKREREAAANPSGYHDWEDRNLTRLSNTTPVAELSSSSRKDGGATTHG